MQLTIVDVFAERRYAGNQLAVVRDASGLSTAEMQDIAREMNFSETAFVLESGSGRARARYFTPDWELPFAGHPTLGTAWVLSGGEGRFLLDLPAGEVPVEFEGELGWFTPPPVRLGGEFDRALAADLVGLAPEQLDDAFPVRFAEVGPQFVIVGVRDLQALAAARLDLQRHEQRLAEGFPVRCVFLFSAQTHAPDADYAARMFFVSAGVREDPATGSANAAFAAYLWDALGRGGRVVVDQGVEMKRPSRLYLDVGDEIRVGGKVQLVAEGRLA
jgi:trans-2,3-dihydro-3-hydroxyanthranilate isomerase